MIVDLSQNGSIADEASFLMALTAFVGLFVGGSKINKRVRRIDHAVNNVNVPITDPELATLGQRVVRVEGNIDEQVKTLRLIAESLNEHVRVSNARHERIEKKLDQLTGVMDVRPIVG